MQALRFPVDLVMERIPLANRWASEAWRPQAVEPRDEAASRARIVECIHDDATGSRWRLSGHAIEMHPSESEGYFLNLTSPEPCVFVMWRMQEDGPAPPARPVLLTVSYNEAARMLDGGEHVDPVPMPDAIRDWMRPFVAHHYKPEPKKKAKRNDPFADAARVRDREGRE